MLLRKSAATVASLVTVLVGIVFSPIALAQQTASASLSGEVTDTEGQKPREKSTDNLFDTADFLRPDAKGPRSSLKNNSEAKVPVKISVNVPHNYEAVNILSAYPYPMQPPRRKTIPRPLPTDFKSLKGKLISSGYTQRTSKEKAYPFGGWRWQYAFNAALRRSNLGVPHVVTEMYSWADDMVRYVQPEVKRLNSAEEDRMETYTRIKEDFDQNRIELETDAVRKGLFPVEVHMQRFDSRQLRYGMLQLPPGSWWMVGTHKVPGLTYYWNLPFEVEANQPKTIELTEANALVIEGGW